MTTVAAKREKRGVPLLLWPLTAVLGTAIFGGSAGFRAGVSFFGGLALAGLWLGISTIAVRRAGHYSPTTSLLAALMSYSGLILFFAVLLASLDSSRIHAAAFAVGLVSAVLISSADQLKRGWVWSARP